MTFKIFGFNDPNTENDFLFFLKKIEKNKLSNYLGMVVG